MSIVQVAC